MALETLISQKKAKIDEHTFPERERERLKAKPREREYILRGPPRHFNLELIIGRERLVSLPLFIAPREKREHSCGQPRRDTSSARAAAPTIALIM